MPRGKKRKESPPVAETTAKPASITAVAETEPPLATSPVEPPSTVGTLPKAVVETEPGRRQFRSWLVDEGRGYSRMTDEKHHCLVLQFAEKPHPDVLTAVKGAGFQFRLDYHGQQNVWVRRNDFEGRLQVEAIEKLLHEFSAGRESPNR